MKISLFGSLVVIALALPTANASFIVNGSFENHDVGIDGGQGRQVFIVGTNPNGISGWTLGGVGDVYLHITPDIGNAIGSTFNNAQAGNVYLDLSGGFGGGGSGNHASTYQDFATTAGSSYVLDFYVSAAFSSTAATINVRLDGATPILNQTVAASAPATNLVWTEQQYIFVANSTTTRLSFRDTSGNDDNVSFVDNVSVNLLSETVVTPEPASMTMMGIGLLSLAGYGARRRNRAKGAA